MFVDNGTHHGYNPEFYKRVMEKRRAADRERAAAKIAEIKERERQERDEAHRRACAEKAMAQAIQQYTVINVMNTKPNVRRLISEMAAANGMSYQDIVGASRNRHVVHVRHLAVRLVADARPDMSVASIGRVFKRDHTSILYALKKTRKEGHWR